MIVRTALPSWPPGDLHRDAQSSSFPCRGIFCNPRFRLQGTGYKHHRIIAAPIFPGNRFTPCLELNLVLEPSPTYICKAGNSLLPPTRTISVSPGQALALRIDGLGEIPTFIYFAIDSCLFKLKREALRCHPRELQGSTGTPDSVLLSFWDLHPLHSLALQAGPIPGYSRM